MNLANRITCARLFLSLLFFFTLGYYRLQTEFNVNLLRVPGELVLNVALFLFLLAVVSDAIDGYVARKLGQVTVFGRIADPFVDKIVISGAFIFLAAMHEQLNDLIWPSMVVLIIGREFLVTSLRGLLEGQGQDFSASISGKTKMVVQSITVGWILLYVANFPDQTWARKVAIVCVCLTLVVTLSSGVDSIVRARNFLRANPQPASQIDKKSGLAS